MNNEIEKLMLMKKLCYRNCYIVGPTGPTARCNKSSIYIFKW